MAKRWTDDEIRQAFRELPMPPAPQLAYRPGGNPHNDGGKVRRMSRWYLPAAAALALGMIGLPAWVHGPYRVDNVTRTGQRKPSPKHLPWRPLGLISVDMMTPTRGWGFAMEGRAGGTNVYQTTSGGTRWVKVGRVADAPGSGDVVYDTLTLDEALVISDFMQGDKTRVQVATTRDGGRLWDYHTVTVRGINLRLSANMLSGGLSSAWANTEDGSFLIMGASPEKRLYVTQNGGKSWSVVGLPAALKNTFGQLSMSTPNCLWVSTGSTLFRYSLHDRTWMPVHFKTATVVGSPKFWDRGMKGVLLTRGKRGLRLRLTTDGGRRWVRGGRVPGTVPAKLIVASGSDWWLRTGFPSSQKDGLGKLWVTRDGGRSWAELGTPKGLPTDLIDPSVTFRSAQYGFLAAPTSATNPLPRDYVTYDGGRTWSQITPEARLSARRMQDVNGVLLGD